MEERGLIRRECDESDRRIWRIWLTDAGKELQAVLPPIALELQEQALQEYLAKTAIAFHGSSLS